jgi:hypothetical protein
MLDSTNEQSARQVWKFQFADGNVHTGYATDARGLKLRAECGYTHVKMDGTADDGWLQVSVAIRKAEQRERFAKAAA